MVCTTLALLPTSRNRYRTRANIYNIQENIFEKVTLFFDTGCYNTLIPKRLAVRCGVPINIKHSYKIGANIVEAEGYLIKKLQLGDFALERLVAFAGDYTGEFSSNILIGTNVLNNWEFKIKRKTNTLQFIEDPPDDLPNKKNIYQNFFDNNGNYMFVQEGNM